VQVPGPSAHRPRLGARDQVRRLSRAAARRGRPGDLAHPQGPGLDREVRRHRRGRRRPARRHPGRRGGGPGRGRPARLRRPAGGPVGRRQRRPDLLRLRPAGPGGRGPARPAAARAQGAAEGDDGPGRAAPALRRPLRDRRRRGAAVGLQAGAGGHHLQAAGRALPFGPQRDLGQGQVPGRARGGDRRLDDDGLGLPLADRRGLSRRQAGPCRPDRHRLRARQGGQAAAALEGAGERHLAVRGQGRAPQGRQCPLGEAAIGGRDRICRLHRRRLDPPGLVQGPARGQAGRRGRGRGSRVGRKRRTGRADAEGRLQGRAEDRRRSSPPRKTASSWA
jgi:hypothetical protein